MKFSKNCHKRMSIVLHNNHSEETLRRTMGQIAPLDSSLERYVEERVSAVKKLYKVLGPSAEPLTNQDARQKENTACAYFNEFIQLFLNQADRDRKGGKSGSRKKTEEEKKDKKQERREKLKEKACGMAFALQNRCGNKFVQFVHNRDNQEKKEIKKIYISDIDLEVSDEFIHRLVARRLRGSLKKEVREVVDSVEVKVYIPDMVEKLLCAVCQKRDLNTYMKQIDSEELKLFCQALLEDYTMEKWQTEIPASIRKQDVKVQVFGEGEECCLKLANGENEKKKYVFQFIKAYACRDRQGREEQLRAFYRLIILFFCGEKAYLESMGKNFELWNFYSLSEYVSDIPKAFHEEYATYLSDREERLAERKKIQEANQNNPAGSGAVKSSDDSQKIEKLDTKKMKQLLRQEIILKYRAAYAVLDRQRKEGKQDQEAFQTDCFWLKQIEDEAEKILLPPGNRYVSANKLRTVWLMETVRKRLTAFLASKFVDYGKAVYHFAMPDLHDVRNGKAVRIGAVLPQFRQGITSFDYERLTADERLERSFIIAIMFAVNNYASAVCPDSAYEANGNVEDVLTLGADDLCKKSYKNAAWHLLQYFGGQSQWAEQPWVNEIQDGEGKDRFILDIREAMYRIRNVSFHYAAGWENSQADGQSVLPYIFKEEIKGIGRLLRKKYFSNSVPRFYSVRDINHLMERLYQREKVLESQIPSFQSVFGMKDLIDNLGNLTNKKALSKLQQDADVVKNFYHTFYFLLKEIYYRGFLQEDGLKKKFQTALAEEYSDEKAEERQRAINNLQSRIKEYERENPRIGFGELCQGILTDYNLQNTQKRVRNNRNDNLPKETYKYFQMLLYKGIRRAFLKYVTEDVEAVPWGCGFLKTPKFKKVENAVSEADFCDGWETELYRNLEKDKGDPWMISWFITGHFMTPKHLNHLKGEIKCYLSYVKGIESRRSAATKPEVLEETWWKADQEQIAETEKQYKRLLRLLDLVSEYCGRISAEWKDYYTDEDEYAEDIRCYLAYDQKKFDISLPVQLRDFCGQKEENSPSGYIGIFYNNGGPILNRNIVRARLYGTERLLVKCLSADRITEEKIRGHYQEAKELEAVFRSGRCETKEQEEKRRAYQQQKNRIELVDIVKYSDIINDLMSQLISWCYLRERDRMYFQIGVHYVRLQFGKELAGENSKFRVLREKSAAEGAGTGLWIEDGAILYQLAAIYTYELPVYCLDQDGYAIVSKMAPAGSQTSQGVNAFCKEYCKEEFENNGDISIYTTGLELFENSADERAVFRFRDYIDHSKYLARRNWSMLYLYSRMYQNFLQHDTKLRNSVTVVFQNILARHFVLAELELSYTVDEQDRNSKKPNQQDGNQNKTEKPKPRDRVPAIRIHKLESEVTVHKYAEKQKDGRTVHRTVKLDYHSEEFLNNLKTILEYNQG